MLGCFSWQKKSIQGTVTCGDCWDMSTRPFSPSGHSDAQWCSVQVISTVRGSQPCTQVHGGNSRHRPRERKAGAGPCWHSSSSLGSQAGVFGMSHGTLSCPQWSSQLQHISSLAHPVPPQADLLCPSIPSLGPVHWDPPVSEEFSGLQNEGWAQLYSSLSLSATRERIWEMLGPGSRQGRRAIYWSGYQVADCISPHRSHIDYKEESAIVRCSSLSSAGKALAFSWPEKYLCPSWY